jgi:opacity protein-like surface antigen
VKALEDVMLKVLTAIAAVALVSAAAVAASTQAEAGYRGCRANAGGALIASGAPTHGRYGKYDFGYCGGYGYADPPAYYPPPYYEYEPAFDGYAAPGYNPNVYYDYPAYRRVYYGVSSCCRPYW